MNHFKVVLIGAGNIAKIHAAILSRLPNVELEGVFDTSHANAAAIAREFGIQRVYQSLEESVASAAHVAHVLTPPDRHVAGALPFIQAGISVFMEKPVGINENECALLKNTSHMSDARVGVNQNFIFNPAYVQLRQVLDSGCLGRPRHLSYIYEVPLRQLSARQFGHWMFREPGNILLEQAVHPLSQIIDLAGSVESLSVLSTPPTEISPGVALHRASQIALGCERMPASLRFHVGANFTVCRMTVVCDDGVAIADMFSNQFHVLARTAHMEPVDNWLSVRKASRQWASSAFAGLRDYSLAMVKLKPRSDPFYLGMKGSIESFYADMAADRTPRIGLDFGSHLVAVCERIARTFQPLSPPVAAPMPSATPDGPCVAVLGGTGFIGSHTVAALLNRGYRVRVMARSATNLQSVFNRPGVEIQRGDVKRPADVAQAVAGARYVVNLAHGGGGPNFEAIRSAMVDSARLVAQACQDAAVERLVHVGSISGLYLGTADAVITGATPTDPQPHTRNDYAHAKALADAEVLKFHRPQGLSVVLLRPGLVVGEGTSPFHGGLGFFNNDQFCVGWNDGRNPLPWVLADDCAQAIVSALASPAAAGNSYNLVGDVCPDARTYIDDLARVLGRPLRFVPSSPTLLWLTEMGKWAIKRVAGQKIGRPYRRDILSRGLMARFDCSDAKRDLNWRPVADADEFHRRALAVHAES